MTSTTNVEGARPPFWRDVRILKVVAQILAVLAAVLFVYVIWFNLTNNLAARGLSLGFDFLDEPFGVPVAGSDFNPGSAIWRALLVGLQNTFALVIVGIPLVTIIGVLVGIGRLSTNWLVAKASAVYVEVLRNTPPLLVIFFAFNAVILQLALISDPIVLFDLIIINNRFIAVASLSNAEGSGVFWAAIAVAVLVAIVVWIWRTRRFDATGEPHHRVLWSLGVVLGVTLAAYFLLDAPVRLSRPVLDGRVLTGGISGLAAFFAMLAALVLYTASHVAEIVRGSILAVPRGQTEAANALALSGFQRLRHVVLPQAMRIAIPPVISQYLNYTKNTSLGIAVGYTEFTLIAFQAIGNGQPAPQLILLVMLGYLIFSLVISGLVNVLNRRLQYVTR
jgi:general L-amino acid transport system permease protein